MNPSTHQSATLHDEMLAELKNASWLLADLSPNGGIKQQIDAVIAKAMNSQTGDAVPCPCCCANIDGEPVAGAALPTSTHQSASIDDGQGQGACQEREWTRWSDQRPPNAPGEYRYRATFPLLGLTVTAEWTEKMHLCGMGYGDSEWWPLSPCYWDGYRRYITHAGLEWSAVQDYDPAGIVWHGLDLLPCPFTGKEPTVEPSGQYIGAPLWRTEALWLSSPGVPKRRWTDAKAMQASWNRRAPVLAGQTS